jgi:hypothetical protein
MPRRRYAALISSIRIFSLPVRASATVALLAMVAAACSSDPDPAAVDNQSAVEVTEDDVEKCLKFDELVGAEVTDFPFIECGQPHTHEIYDVTSYDENDVYPGFEVIETDARLACLTAFEPYVGRNSFDSELFYTWIVPTLDGWNDSDSKDREILCLIGRHDGDFLIDSVKGRNI